MSTRGNIIKNVEVLFNKFFTIINDVLFGKTEIHSGRIVATPDSGPTVFYNKDVTTASVSGSEQSFSMSIDDENFIKCYAEADDYGGIENQRVNIPIMATYANNGAAVTAGLVVGDLYRTSTGVVMVRY